MSQKKIQFYTILYHFVLARFLQIEGGAKKQIRTPCGGPNPRARRAGERPAEPRDKAAGEANFVIRCGCVLRLSVGRDVEELVSKIIFVIFSMKNKSTTSVFLLPPYIKGVNKFLEIKIMGAGEPPKTDKTRGGFVMFLKSKGASTVHKLHNLCCVLQVSLEGQAKNKV